MTHLGLHSEVARRERERERVRETVRQTGRPGVLLYWSFTSSFLICELKT